DEHRKQRTRRSHHVIGGDDIGALVAGKLSVVLERAVECRAQTLLMSAAIGCRYGVAVGRDEPVFAAEPGDRPFDRAVAAGPGDLAGEDFLRHPRRLADTLFEKVLEAARKVKNRALRRLLVLDMRGVAAPANLDTAIEIGLGTRHAEKPRGTE